MTTSRDQEIRDTMFDLREKASKINSKRRRVKSVNIKKGLRAEADFWYEVADMLQELLVLRSHMEEADE